MTRRRKLATTLGSALLVAAALPLGSQVNAADHRDGMQATDDPLADITDIYAWHTDGGTIVMVLGFNGIVWAARMRLAEVLIKSGKAAEAKPHLDALIQQWTDADPGFVPLEQAKELLKKT